MLKRCNLIYLLLVMGLGSLTLPPAEAKPRDPCSRPGLPCRVRRAILHGSRTDPDKAQKKLNHETTSRGSCMMIDRYWCEQLGQSMAYAHPPVVATPAP